jgi:hypothetical protein
MIAVEALESLSMSKPDSFYSTKEADSLSMSLPADTVAGGKYTYF